MTVLPLTSEPGYRIDCTQYRLIARHRLGLLPFDSMRDAACVSCAAHTVETPTLLVDPDHAHSCVRQKGTSIDQRHEVLKLLLARLLRSCGWHVEVEPRFPPRTESSVDADTGAIVTTAVPPVDIHGDLLLIRDNQRLLLDVTVARPTCLTQLRRSAHTSASVIPLAAASDAEKRKHRTYGAECAHHGWRLVPFALETYGALGASARRFLEQVSAHSTDRSPSDFLAHATNLLSVALQVGNAHVASRGAAELHLCEYRRGMSHLPQGASVRQPGIYQRSTVG